MDSAVIEAKVLEMQVRNALQSMNFNREDYEESEVLFRLESIRGMLIMAHNDALALLKAWKGEE